MGASGADDGRMSNNDKKKKKNVSHSTRKAVVKRWPCEDMLGIAGLSLLVRRLVTLAENQKLVLSNECREQQKGVGMHK